MQQIESQNQDKIDSFRTKLRSVLKTEKSNIAQIEYIDFNNNIQKLMGSQRIVVYGRKGTGKTTLLEQVKLHSSKDSIIPLFIDCKDYRNHSYPDLLIKILLSLFENLDNVKINWYSKIMNKSLFKHEIKELKKKLEQPDSLTKEMMIENSGQEEIKSEVSSKVIPYLNNSIGSKSTASEKQSEKYSITTSKIYYLEKELENYKRKINEFTKNRKFSAVYLLLDEYYYVNKIDQPILIDYLYRLFFHTPCWIKLATNRYQTQLQEKKVDGGFFGMTEGEEYTTIDLDFTLEKFSSAEEFLRKIMNSIAKKSNIEKVGELFTDGAFKRIVWASGGVTRDFINLLIGVLDNIQQNKKIDTKLINYSAQKYFDEKLSDFSTEYEKSQKVRELWEKIFYFCIEIKKTTAFLVEVNPDAIDKRKNFQDLIDARLIHLVKKNITSKTHSGKRFNAYILSVGSYAKYIGLRKRPIKEINILRDDAKAGDSVFRYGTPILKSNDLDKTNEELKSIEENELKMVKKERNNLRELSEKAKIHLTLDRF